MFAKVSLSVLLIAAFLLSACGPSAEQIATMTASAWTPTPKPTYTPPPTLTPTPIPYDLVVTVANDAGAPIPGASILFPESGKPDPILADAAGRASWNNLNSPNGTLTVAAQGYFKAEQAVTLERGPNEVVVKMARDPFGMLPSDACGAGESLLLLEDYQDGEAQGWNPDQKNPAAHYVGPAPDEAANSVWTLDATKITNYDNAWIGANYGNGNQGQEPGLFGDVVWRMKFMVNRPTAPSFNWHELAIPNGSRYTINFSGGQSQIHVIRSLNDANGEPGAGERVGSVGFNQAAMQWRYVEISQFQGNVQLWIDGIPLLDFTDPEPLPAGGIGIWIGPFTDKSLTVMYFDNISVCGLSAPFASILTPAP